MKKEDEISKLVIGAAIQVHRQLGPGLLESAYEECLAFELADRAIPFERQKPIPLRYKQVELNCGFKVDLIVAKLVVVELKAVDSLVPIHSAQVLTYLKLTHCKLGLLVNFNEMTLIKGLKRLVLNL